MVEHHSFTNTVCKYKQLQRNSIGDPSKRVVHTIELSTDWVGVIAVTNS